MKEFYTRSITATAYAIVILLPLFYNEYMFYLVGFTYVLKVWGFPRFLKMPPSCPSVLI